MKVSGFSDLVEIYNGYQSRVYKAIRESDQLAVALKTPASEFPDPRQLSALKREFRVLEVLKGKGIPTPLDYVELKNSAVIVREWVEGISLKRYQQTHSISILNALQISIDIARLLSEVHRQSFCHRDISPSNILIHPETEEVSLLDFCSSLEFPDRARSVIRPLFIEGSKPYMSPEQTGRMNRGLDFRTDFYSFGVLLYELFTGQLPFETKDSNELIYSHIAIEPIAPSSVDPSIPEAISNIILKLMSKSPDARYQSAEGIEADLVRCLDSWKTAKQIDNFQLAMEDLQDWFIIPDKMYGRAKETELLIQAFEQTSKGCGQLVFVSGHSGIGKTSLIRELYKPLVARGGYISSGKYDQVLRHQPYSAILQAVSGLVRQIMSESQADVEYWREKIRKGVGVNGQLLIDVIPELEQLIGKQPSVQILSAEAASTRFNTTFYNLMHSLGHSEKPLVFFIDDLQWIDPASLSLIEALAPSLSHSSLMIIGAYRNNEVASHHPLMIAMPNLESSCRNVLSVELQELPVTILESLLKDTIQLPQVEYKQLNSVLCEKTHGNPLVYKTMLTTLYGQKAIYFDYERKHWGWDSQKVADMPRAENSVAMLQSNMTSLAKETLELLTFASCIGNTFNLNLLTGLIDLTRSEIATALIPAVSRGYIQPLDDDFELHTTDENEQLADIRFQFAHDRIQQAAYSLVTSEEQNERHWAIGQQLLLSHTPATTTATATGPRHQDLAQQDKLSDGVLFDIVEHLNQGRQDPSWSESTTLVELNIQAASKAKRSAAFSVAHGCLKHAQELLADRGEAPDSELAINVDLELAQACYLVADFDHAEQLYAKLRTLLTKEHDKLTLYNVQAKQYHHQGKYQKSVENEYQALRLLGITLPDDDESLLALFAKEKETIETLLAQQDYDYFFDQQYRCEQQEVSEESYSLTHELLFDMFTDGYLLGRGPLIAAVAAISARLSMEQGNCAVTSAGYINFATVLCSSGEYKAGHDLGKLAIRLADKYQNPVFKNYTYHVFALGINHWLEPLRSSYDYWHDASKLSIESGSPYAGWVFLQMPHVLFASGANLEQVTSQTSDSLDYFNANRLSDMAHLLKVIVEQPLKHLKGETASFSSLDDDGFSTSDLITQYQDAPFFLGHTVYSVLRATLLSRNILPAEQLKQWLPVIENTVQAQIIQVDSCLYTALHLSAGCSQLVGEERESQLSWIKQLVDKFDNWAQLCPSNFKHKYLMLKAELLRLEGDVLGAFDHYDLARDSALESQFLMDAALTDELAGLFWQEAGKTYQSQVYLKRSLEGYEQWGAKGKVLWMKATYPDLDSVQKLTNTSMNTTLESTLGTEDFSTILDMGSVVKASQAVSQHMKVDKLAEELLNLAVENAGATRGLLLVESGGEFMVTHKAVSDNTARDNEGLDVPYSDSHCLSRSIVRYVINSAQPVVYTPSHRDEQFERCPYLLSQGEISVLCLPIVRQKKMSGVLYLENTHMADAFQSDRVQTLKIIASQAAISLENARMYHDLEMLNENLEAMVKERTKSLTEKNKELYILSTTDQLTGLYNRRYVEEQILQHLTNIHDTHNPLSLLMLDVDHFKSINDLYGHSVGDRVLENVSSSIKDSVRNFDVAGRWGGEEFIVLCMSDIDGAASNAERLGDVISSLDHSPAGKVTVSIGVTPVLNQDTIDSVLNRVDEALYEAKNSGRNQVIIRMK